MSETYLPEPAGERAGVALCLSGGGYRAALFHLGALRRLAGIRCHATRFAAAVPAAAAPFPEWLDEERVRSAMADSHKRKILGRWRLDLHLRP